jgi:hypothetical protein
LPAADAPAEADVDADGALLQAPSVMTNAAPNSAASVFLIIVPFCSDSGAALHR